MEVTLEQALQNGVKAHKSGQIQEADRYYTAILKVEPKHPDTNHNMGVLAVGVGKLKEALPFFKTALDVNPNIDQFWFSYLDVLIRLDRLKDAELLLKQAKDHGLSVEALNRLRGMLSKENKQTTRFATVVNPPQTQVQSLLDLFSGGEFKKVISNSEALLTKFPNSINLYNLIGASNKSLGNLDQAIEAYQKAINIKPDYAEAYFNIAIILNKIDKARDAISYYKKAISINPEFFEAYLNVGITLQKIGDLDEAAKTYKLLLRLKPDYADAYNNLGIVLRERGELNASIRAYDEALKVNPNYAEAYYNLGNALKDQSKLMEAIEVFKKAVLINPKLHNAYYNMGIAFQRIAKLEEAENSYKKAISIKHDFADAFCNLGVVLRRQERFREAISAYNSALSIDPDYLDARNNLGEVFLEKGEVDRALIIFRKVLSEKSDHAETIYNLGNALQKKGETVSAIEAYKEAVKVRPQYTKAWVNGADLFEKLNQVDSLGLWLIQAYEQYTTVPDEIKFMRSKYFWRNKNFTEAYDLILDIDVEALPSVRRQDYLNLRAKCYDKMRDFDNAYLYFEKCNLLVLQSQEYRKQNPGAYLHYVRDQLQKLKSNNCVKFKKPQISKQENIGSTPVFLIGFPRSGTTLLDTLLRSHSEIIVIEEKPMLNEVKRFLTKSGYQELALADLPTEIIIEARAIYEEELKRNSGDYAFASQSIDKLPLNILETPLISQLYPQAKFILALRHPMDAILSCWMQNFKLNSAMSVMLDLNRISELYCIAMDTFDTCRYRNNLNVHEIRYEDLINDFKLETSELLKFLDLEWEPDMNNFQQTALNRGRINTPSYSQVVQPIYQDATYRWLNYKKFLEHNIKVVEPWIKKYKYT